MEVLQKDKALYPFFGANTQIPDLAKSHINLSTRYYIF